MQAQALDVPASDQGACITYQPLDQDPDAIAAFRESQQLLVDLHQYVCSEEFLATVERVQEKVAQEDRCEQEESEVVSDSPDWVVVKKATDSNNFEMIDNRDIIEAMAEFIAQSLAKMNETKSMPSRTIQFVLSGIFGDIRNKSMLAHIWGWGSFLYTAYGWSSYTLSIYRHPALLKFILQTIWSAAKWVIGRQ